jgi:ArsR family transcriptional regulator
MQRTYGIKQMSRDFKDFLSAYCEQTRLRIALLLDGADICVNCLVAVLDLPQSTISRHLAVLRNAGLIRASKKGSNTYYTLETRNEPFGRINRKIISAYKEELAGQEPFSSDIFRLQEQLKICPVDCRVA